MDGPGATEGEERVLAQVAAALDPVDAGGGGHGLVCHAMAPPRCPRHVEAERAGDVLLDAATRGLPTQAHAPAQEELGVEIAEQEVRVGDRREATPEAVAGGTGVGARAVGTDLQEAHPVHARDRSEEHTSELQSLTNLVCRLLLEKKKQNNE